MNIIPKLYKIEIERWLFDGKISSTLTSTPSFRWSGTRYYKWLGFEFKRNLKYGKHFVVEDDRLTFVKSIKSGVELTMSY